MEGISSDVQQFQALESHRKLAVFGILTLVFIVAIGIGLYMSKSKFFPQTSQQAGQEEMGDKTSITLSPATQTATVGQTVSITVMIDKNPAPVTDVVLTFDPTVLELVSTTNGEVYEALITPKVKPGPGEVFVSAAVPPTSTTQISTGVMATVSFKTLKSAGSTSIGFDTTKTIAAQSGINRIGKTQGATITIK